jgi:hypothetical protein
MKIDYIIVSTNDNNLYKDFWPVVKKLWYELIGIKPILVEICDTNEIVDYGDHIIHKIKKIEDIDTGFQSQIARMYVTKFYQNSVCLTSDIDMLPLCKNYFVNDIEDIDNDNLVIFSSDAYQGVVRYPICYNASKGKVFNDIMKFEDTFEEYCIKLNDMGLGWDTDELYFGKMVNLYENQSIITKLNRGWEYGRAKKRIDRVYWTYDENELKSQNYVDSHSLRPYSRYKNEIDKLINFLI